MRTQPFHLHPSARRTHSVCNGLPLLIFLPTSAHHMLYCPHIPCPCYTPCPTRQVKLMGDFDSWTRGFELSAANIDSDGVIKTFEAEVPLLPGRYRAKFLVDGGWRLASDWPTENDELVRAARLEGTGGGWQEGGLGRGERGVGPEQWEEEGLESERSTKGKRARGIQLHLPPGLLLTWCRASLLHYVCSTKFKRHVF